MDFISRSWRVDSQFYVVVMIVSLKRVDFELAKGEDIVDSSDEFTPTLQEEKTECL